MASKKFYRWALVLNILTSLLSVLFSYVAFMVLEKVSSEGLVTFVYYVKRFFDLLAVFTGYGTIMYAFTRYDFVCGVKSVGIFSISVVISFLWQVFGSIVGFMGENILGSSLESTGNIEFVLFIVFYACGYCFITQFIPALVVAVFTHYFTKHSTNTQTLFKLRMIATITILVINIFSAVFFNIIPFLKENNFLVYREEVWSIVFELIESFIIYGPIQFAMYYVTHHLYSKYTDKTNAITTNSQKKSTVKKTVAVKKTVKSSKNDIV